MRIRPGYLLTTLALLVWLAASPGLAQEPPLSREGSSGSPLCARQYAFTVRADTEGAYWLLADYQVTLAGAQKLTVSVRVNGQLQQPGHERLTLPALWRDDSQEYRVNDFGSHLYPVPVLMEQRQTEYLRERVYCADTPLAFWLKAGENAIDITVTESEAVFYGVSLRTPCAPVPFDAYLAAMPSAPAPARLRRLTLEGEKYAAKSDSAIRASRSRATALHPFDASGARINALAGVTWDAPGEQVHYAFTVEESGVYYLCLRYQQSDKSDMRVFKTLRVDGQTPCAPLAAYGFDYTGSAVRESILSCQGRAIPLYLEQGEHTLTLVSTAAPLAAAHAALRQVVTQMNSLALDIRLIAGNRVDKDRDWRLAYYLPDTRARLMDILERIDTVYALLQADEVGSGESTLSTLAAVRRQIDGYLTDKDGMDDLVNQLSSFAQASGSMAESLSLMAPDMLLQPLLIDRIYLQSSPVDLPGEDCGLLQSAWREIRKAALSFFVDADTAQTNRKDKLNVWLIGSSQELEVLRELAQSAYPDGSVHVALANESKIQLAIAAGNAPDVVLGGGIGQPYQLGIRNAVYDLSRFADFAGVSQWFYPASFVPVTLEGAVYALPQTLDMWVMFYRKDILGALGLTVPQTWDELIALLPTLYRYGMNVNTALAYGGALKTFTQTMPLIMQSGGALYASDGMSGAFCTPAFTEGFTLLTELYTKYGLSTNIGNFYSSFRNGTAPLGISALTTYTLLRQAASELDGLWGIALMPALESEGELSRAHPAVLTGCYLLGETKRAEEGWQFLKWWMSADTQTAFSVRLQSTYGEEYLWLTANRDALACSTLFSYEDRQVVLSQLEHLQEVPPHPASMLAQRALSDAWNKVVFDGVDVRSALDSAQLEVNRGIDKKLRQFGLIDDTGAQARTLWREGAE